MSFLRRPAVLMVLGFVVLGLSALTFAARDRGGSNAVPADLCSFPPCRAADNPVPARGYEGAYVAADPTDPDHIVLTDANLLDSRCGWHTTFNRGKDWTDGFFELPPGYAGCRLNGPAGGHVPNGSVVRAPSGSYYAVFGSTNPDEGRGDHILVAKSTDGGLSFGPSRVVAKPPAPQVGLGRPLMTAVTGPGGRDSVLVTFWQCRPASTGAGTQCDGALFARSDDGGETFAPAVLVNDPPAGQNPSQPAVDSEGNLYVTFQRRFSDGPVDLFLARSADGGRTWSQGFIDRQEQIGVQYDPAKLVVEPRNNALYSVWSDSRTGRQQIFFRKSLDRGATWSERAVLLSPARDISGSSRSPSISLAPDGRIDVVYYHTGPEAGVQAFDDVFWSYSTDGGENFVSRQVNDTPIDRRRGYSGPAASLGQVGNHYPPTVSSTNSAAFVVWSDTVNADARTNTQDIMLRRMEVVAATLPP